MKFAVENFKIFKERQEFDIKPITILVGPNGSGKSSVIRAMEVLSGLGNGSASRNIDNYIEYLKRRLVVGNKSILPKSYLNIDAQIHGNYVATIEVMRDFVVEGQSQGELLLILSLSGNSVTNIELVDPITKELILKSKFLGGFSFNVPYFYKIAKKLSTSLSGFASKFPLPDHKVNFLEASQLGYERSDFDRNIKWDILSVEELYNQYQLSLENICKEASRKFWNEKLFNNHELNRMWHSLVEFIEFIEEDIGGIEIDFAKGDSGKMVDNFINSFVFSNLNTFLQESIGEYVNLNFVSTNRMIKKRLDIANPENELEIALFNISKQFSYNEDSFLIKQFTNMAENDFTSELKKYLSKEFLGFAEDINMSFDKKNEIFEIDLKINNKLITYSNLGFGIINSLSILINLAIAHNETYSGLKRQIFFEKTDRGYDIPFPFYKTLLAIEEPEMNLHPSAQSKLADVFADSVNNHGTTLILETHSEYLIRKLQYLVAMGKLKKEDIQIYYFFPPNEIPEGEKQVYPINIEEDGSLTKNFGKGFYDEAGNLDLLLYQMDRTRKN